MRFAAEHKKAFKILHNCIYSNDIEWGSESEEIEMHYKL